MNILNHPVSRALVTLFAASTVFMIVILEHSKVEMVDEMVQMMISQQAYEMNAKMIQTGDDMLGQVSQLKR